MASVSVRYIVTDVDAAIDFYVTRLGFEIQMHPNDLFAMLVHDDLRLVLVKPADPGQPAGGGAAMPDGTMQAPGGWNRFSIEVPDIEAAVGKLRQSGTRFRNDIVDGVGGRQIILEDPSGNPVELFEPIQPEARLSRPRSGLPMAGPAMLSLTAIREGLPMAKITVGRENSDDIEIYYEDHGSGQPVVLIHGYPLNGHSWEKQERVLLGAGYRVITYDRRGFGQSSQPTTGYDYDTFAADLHALVSYLDLTDMVLCGFSMGTGEVTRYLGTYGSSRVAKAVLMGAIPPYLLKAPDNPDGVDRSVFDGIKDAVVADRPAYFKNFLDNFYNVDVLRPDRISDEAWQASFIVAVSASPYAAHACVDTWLTDFRADLPKIDVPVLLIHGDADRILPYPNTAARLPELIKDLTFVTVEGGPHNVSWTHSDIVNPALLDFLAR